ncbi:MAG TPA: hypothetical protein VG126_07725 [Thermoleophilaceae bacterium]|nr:hypothetical protein [Thermoleophilaceae bacterium]
MSHLVTEGPLNWAIARFARPTDGARTGTVRAGYLGRYRIRASITRVDIAAFLLDQTTDTRFYHGRARDQQLTHRRTSAKQALPLPMRLDTAAPGPSGNPRTAAIG